MDADLIYEKTMAGEDAVKQRTRVVQRNTRMVLILVDGKSSIGELYEKTGSPQIVDAAIQDLERDGLIAPKLEQDSVWEQSRKLAEEIKAAALNRLAKEQTRSEPEAASPRRIEPADGASFPPSRPPEPFSVLPLSVAPFSTFGPASVAPPLSPASAGAPASADAASEEPVRKGLLAGLFARRSDADDGIAPIRRGERRKTFSWPLALFVAVIGSVVTLAAVFLLYPYDSLKPQVEAELSRIAGRPVTVRAIGASLSPKPAITLTGIGGVDATAGSVARIHLLPELFSLLGSHPRFISIEVDGASVTPAMLAALPKMIGSTVSAGDSALTRSLRLTGLDVSFAGVTFAGLECEVRSDNFAHGAPLTFTSPDHSVKVAVLAQPGGFVAEVEALGWQPQAESRFRFDSLQARIVWDGAQFAVNGFDARIFDGSIQGGLTLGQQLEVHSLDGEFAVRHMNLKRAAEALGFGNRYAGELAGTVRITARAGSRENLLRAATGDGRFTVVRGTLGGIDLVESVRRGKGTVSGGETRFEQMTGRLAITPEAIRLADLALSSGLLRAGGNLDITHDAAISGRFDVEMRGSANVVRMAVGASGTLKEPVLQAGR